MCRRAIRARSCVQATGVSGGRVALPSDEEGLPAQGVISALRRRTGRDYCPQFIDYKELGQSDQGNQLHPMHLGPDQ